MIQKLLVEELAKADDSDAEHESLTDNEDEEELSQMRLGALKVLEDNKSEIKEVENEENSNEDEDNSKTNNKTDDTDEQSKVEENNEDVRDKPLDTSEDMKNEVVKKLSSIHIDPDLEVEKITTKKKRKMEI
eukprot:UN32516